MGWRPAGREAFLRRFLLNTNHTDQLRGRIGQTRQQIDDLSHASTRIGDGGQSIGTGDGGQRGEGRGESAMCM